MMEVASTYETSVNFHQTTRRYIPEDSYVFFLQTSINILAIAFLQVVFADKREVMRLPQKHRKVVIALFADFFRW
jgi:hypothetical protein